MPRLQLLLFDANVVIELHSQGLWQNVISKCDVTLTRTVASDEAQFWEDQSGQKHYFDLENDIAVGRINCVDVTTKQVACFLGKFSPLYLDKLDPGETESLALVFASDKEWLISSGDAIVYKVLGRMAIGERGISLEEVLRNIGLAFRHPVKWPYSKQFREKYTKDGEIDNITGLGLSDKAK